MLRIWVPWLTWHLHLITLPSNDHIADSHADHHDGGDDLTLVFLLAEDHGHENEEESSSDEVVQEVKVSPQHNRFLVVRFQLDCRHDGYKREQIKSGDEEKQVKACFFTTNAEAPEQAHEAPDCECTESDNVGYSQELFGTSSLNL